MAERQHHLAAPDLTGSISCHLGTARMQPLLPPLGIEMASTSFEDLSTIPSSYSLRVLISSTIEKTGLCTSVNLISQWELNLVPGLKKHWEKYFDPEATKEGEA